MTSQTDAVFPSVDELGSWLPQYQIEQRIFSGIHSAIYVALQPALERQVMIRVMPEPEPQDVPLLMDRLRTRAKVVHPSIVSVFDFGRTHAGPLYLVTEHVDGGLLDARIREQPLTPKEAYQLALQLCESLQVVHDHQVVHGALSSHTVLVTRQGDLKLTGIGMLEMPGGELSWLGESTATFDDDIRALGGVIHEMFCGVPAASPEQISPSLPAAFARVISRCVDNEPSRRFEEPKDVRAALEDALRTEQRTAAAATAGSSAAAPEKPRQSVISKKAPAPAAVPQMVKPSAPAPPRYAPGHLPQPVYHPPRRRSLKRRIDDFLWDALRTSLHLTIIGGTVLIIGAYWLLKDKVVFFSADEDEPLPASSSAPADPAPAPVVTPKSPLAKPSRTVEELDRHYAAALRQAQDKAIQNRRGEDVTALQAEQRRIQRGDGVPDTDAEETPRVIMDLRAEYRRQRSALPR